MTVAEDKTEEKDDSSSGSVIKTFLNAVFTSVIVLLGLVVVVVWIIPIFIGAKPVTVLSGSMEPTLSAGDVIWVDTKDDSTRIKIGDIVVYHPKAYDSTLVTHRVISVNTGTEKAYITQGDANSAADDPIVEGQIVGTVKPPLSYVGMDSDFVSFPKAGYLQQHLLQIGVVIIAICLIMSIFSTISAKAKLKKKGDKNL